MNNGHREFLKKIKLPEDSARKNEDSRKTRGSTHKMSKREQNDLQRELEEKYEELFGGLKDDEE